MRCRLVILTLGRDTYATGPTGRGYGEWEEKLCSAADGSLLCNPKLRLFFYRANPSNKDYAMVQKKTLIDEVKLYLH